MTQQLTQLRIGVRDWEHRSWESTFYPSDLPAEWRLSYLANEVAAVWVPESRWLSGDIESDCDRLEEWAEDVADGFLFVLEVSTPVSALNRRVEALGESFGGLVVAATALNSREWLNSLADEIPKLHLLPVGACDGSWPSPLRCVFTQPPPPSDCPEIGSLALTTWREGETARDLRGFVESFAASATLEQGLLFLDGAPSPSRLTEARTLVELMGL